MEVLLGIDKLEGSQILVQLTGNKDIKQVADSVNSSTRMEELLT